MLSSILNITNASTHLWRASGMPAPQWPVVARKTAPCATCGVTSSDGVAVSTLTSSTFSRHADFLRFGDHVCTPCAWMYSDPKRHHRSVLAIDERIWWPALGVNSVTDDRPSWQWCLAELLAAPEDAMVTAVLTTDPKPRMWPLTRSSYAVAPGLYVHSPDHDLSAFVSLDRAMVREQVAIVTECLALGYSKRAIVHGLATHKVFLADVRVGMEYDAALRPHREQRHDSLVIAALTTLAPSK